MTEILRFRQEAEVVHDPKTCELNGCVACKYGMVEISDKLYVEVERLDD